MRFVSPILCAVFVFANAACSSNGGSSGSGSDPEAIGDGEVPGHGVDAAPGVGPGLAMGTSSGGSGTASGAPPSDASSPEPGEEPSGIGGTSDAPEPSQPNPGQAGILTAGTWDDNRNFERFLGYRSGLLATGLPGVLPISEEELQAAHGVASVAPAAHATLDISLVIDTTGSMGDEIAYLQAEFMTLSSAINQTYPGSEQRWSLVTYKDTEDPYVVRWFDFRTDAEDFRQHLADQSAAGGGDFPEAPDQAFETAQQLSWRDDESTARLVFWVADAPHHDNRATAMAGALRGMQGLGVHIYPVASSGVDELTELSMRTAAAFTGGRYLFLTNDSGIGGDHKEPTIPCYFVTSLRDAILRMVDIELSGQYHEPAASEVLRTGGDPQDGACELTSGETAFAF